MLLFFRGLISNFLENLVMSARKPRSPNFSAEEKRLLISLFEANGGWAQLAVSFKNDTVTLARKAKMWTDLAVLFNSKATGPKRSGDELAIAWKNIRQRSKNRTSEVGNMIL